MNREISFKKRNVVVCLHAGKLTQRTVDKYKALTVSSLSPLMEKGEQVSE